jgi:transcriptional regulator with XRE-family HTH domain
MDRVAFGHLSRLVRSLLTSLPAHFASRQQQAQYPRKIETIGDRIRARREELGLSLRDIAQPGVSAGYISRVERSERQPSGKALRALAAALDVSTHWLETGRDDPAETLARIVLEHRAEPLPRRATTLAREILQSH